jgi:hypothetical protein
LGDAYLERTLRVVGRGRVCPLGDRLALNIMSFKVHLANYVLDNTKLSTMPDAAVQALIEGFDSPSLTKLAGESGDHSNLFEIEELLRHTLSELGLSLPSKDEAAHILISYWAERIVSGSVQPREGARHILVQVYHRTEHPNDKFVGETLDISSLVGLAYEYDDLHEGFIEFEGKPLTKAEAFKVLDREVIEASRKYLLGNR